MDVKSYVTEQVKALLAAPSCCQEAKDAGQNWLDAVGTEKEKEAAAKLIAELEQDVVPIEGLIAFAGSEMGEKTFGKEMAAQLVQHAKEVQAAGGKYCDCPACQAGLAILEKKAELL
jgi:hypothetical protein